MFPFAYSNNAAPKSSLNVWLGKVVKFQDTLVFPLSIHLYISAASGSEDLSSSPKVVNGAAFPSPPSSVDLYIYAFPSESVVSHVKKSFVA